MFRRRLIVPGLVLGLLVLGLAYALMPLRDGTRAPVTPSGDGGEAIFLATPVSTRPTPARREPNAGADVSSVAASEVLSSATPLPVPTVATAAERYAFLLLGYGGGGHDGAYLTDSLMVVVVDPAHKTLTLLSLPRDSWVPLSFDGKTTVYNKLNTAYAFAQDDTLFPDRLARYRGPRGPGNLAMDTASRLLGIPIAYYLGLDFAGFRQMVDTVGGIDVVVPASFSAQYPANDDSSVDASWLVVRFTQGPEHMNGERAIEFARAREAIDNPDEGSDFARSRRQRLIMQAFKTRLFEPGGLIHLPQLLAIASQHVDSNYAIPDAARLGQLALDWKNLTIYQTALTTGNYLEDATGPDGTYLAVPSSPGHSWAQIRAFAGQLWRDPAVGVAMASTTIVVENDSGVAGLAARVSAGLTRLGYQVGDPTSGPFRAHTRLVDGTGGKAAPLVGQLARDLRLAALDVAQPSKGGTSASPIDEAGATGADVLVLQLGEDQANLALAVANDAAAPSSTVGVVKFGVWPYISATPTETPTTATRPSPSPTPPGASASPTPLLDQASVAVPSLVGLSEADAQRAINAAGLMTTYVNYQTIDDVPDRRYFLSIAPGHVLSQSPGPGAIVPRGTRVLLAVRKP